MSQEKEVMVSEEQQEVTELKFDGAVADGSSLGSVEDLGGPTPTNNKPDDESNKLKALLRPRHPRPRPASDASPKKHESVEAENAEGDDLIEIDLSADVAALTEGEDLSEEFKAKAATIFELQLFRLNEELDRVHGEYATALSEQAESVASLAEQVDEYLTYAVQEWMGKNEIAIETGLKSEIAESVVAGLKKVFVENHIEVPEEKTDIISEMVTELDSMEAKLNEQIDKNVALTREVGAFVKNGIVSEISEGLALPKGESLLVWQRVLSLKMKSHSAAKSRL